jgi:hypothetical protein
VKTFHKVALVGGGYIVCFLLASAAAAIRVADTNASASQAASGMYGFGDTISFVAVFGVSALVPTGAALFFLRPYSSFWKMFSVLSLGLAITGVAAAILFAIGRHEAGSRLATWAELSVLRLLISPLLALTFLMCAFFSPRGFSRRALLTATAIESTVSLSVGVFWFIHVVLHRP